MARIRSIHPGQWTDEDFVSMSPLARLLALAIRTEADDQGVFEWKPVQIKMRLFPADNLDIQALLAELVEFRQCVMFEHEGRQYGAIRNFRTYQRPKKPKAVHFLPQEFRTYVGLRDDGSEPDDVSDDESSEPEPRKREANSAKGGTRAADVGGRMEEVGGKDSPPPDGGGPEPPASGQGLLEIPDDMVLAPTELARRMVERWNAMAAETGLPQVQKLTDARRKQALARLRDVGGLSGWDMALARIRGSPFLTGQNDTGWTADFDFIIREGKFAKLMEGAYDRGRKHRESADDQTARRRQVLAAAVERRLGDQAGAPEGGGGPAGADP